MGVEIQVVFSVKKGIFVSYGTQDHFFRDPAVLIKAYVVGSESLDLVIKW